MRFRIFLAVSLITTFSAAAQAQVVTLNKGGYTLSYDCTNRAALRVCIASRHRLGSAPFKLQLGYRITQWLRRPNVECFLCQCAFGL